jgi:hypothetical protein
MKRAKRADERRGAWGGELAKKAVSAKGQSRGHPSVAGTGLKILISLNHLGSFGGFRDGQTKGLEINNVYNLAWSFGG